MQFSTSKYLHSYNIVVQKYFKNLFWVKQSELVHGMTFILHQILYEFGFKFTNSFRILDVHVLWWQITSAYVWREKNQRTLPSHEQMKFHVIPWIHYMIMTYDIWHLSENSISDIPNSISQLSRLSYYYQLKWAIKYQMIGEPLPRNSYSTLFSFTHQFNKILC